MRIIDFQKGLFFDCVKLIEKLNEIQLLLILLFSKSHFAVRVISL
jgi:hypothetical protein